MTSLMLNVDHFTICDVTLDHDKSKQSFDRLISMKDIWDAAHSI